MPARYTFHGISAVTLATNDMAAAVTFYLSLGFEVAKGGAAAPFTTFHLGGQALNLTAEAVHVPRWWGRVIFYVSDVDALYGDILAAGLRPDFAPRAAPWGERYFHITDPDGHELSFAWPLAE